MKGITLVKYDNKLNKIPLGTLKAQEADLLMGLCCKFRDVGLKELTIEYAELKEICGFEKHFTNPEISELLDSTLKKLMSAVVMKDDFKTYYFTLFNEFVTDSREGTLTATVNEKYSHILNNLSNNFTAFDLKLFSSLGSKYTRTLFRLLKQYESTRYLIVTFEELRKQLGLKNSLPNSEAVRILDRVCKELKPVFPSLEYEIIRARRRGAPIKNVEFRWKVAVDDDLPGQRTFRNTEEFDEILQDMSKSEKLQTLKIAADIVKGKKKPKKKTNEFTNFANKNDYDVAEIEKAFRAN